MLEQSTNLKKPQNSNKVISKPEIRSGELHATFVGNHVVDGTETQRTRPVPIAARERGRCQSQPENEAGADHSQRTRPVPSPSPGPKAYEAGPTDPASRVRRSGAHRTLVSGHQVDATLVALIPAEGSLEESNDESQDLFLAVLTSTDRHHVCVVMLTS